MLFVHMFVLPVALSAPVALRSRSFTTRCRLRLGTNPAMGSDSEFDSLPAALARVRVLKAGARNQLLERSRKNPNLIVSGILSSEPSFTRLFTHATWDRYTGRTPLVRWFDTTRSVRHSPGLGLTPSPFTDRSRPVLFTVATLDYPARDRSDLPRGLRLGIRHRQVGDAYRQRP